MGFQSLRDGANNICPIFHIPNVFIFPLMFLLAYALISGLCSLFRFKSLFTGLSMSLFSEYFSGVSGLFVMFADYSPCFRSMFSVFHSILLVSSPCPLIPECVPYFRSIFLVSGLCIFQPFFLFSHQLTGG